MRLMDTTSPPYTIEEFLGDSIPPYAILSHTWGQEEVTFEEWQNIDSSTYQKSGFKKIQGACMQAKRDGFNWLWVDTNCIQRGPLELAEAINSMFRWYRDAEICYAYLQDVPSSGPNGQPEEVMALFEKSRWFHRGWTLQELLAPEEVVFYTEDWQRLGSKAGLLTSKKDESLTSKIAEITGIDEAYLNGSMPLRTSSVAKRLSWMANRKTTRVEDMAYALLGIFDLHMTFHYGEGMKAFTRLQNKIVKTSSDHSIFCWTWDSDVPPGWVSMLAPSPKQFRGSGRYVEKHGAAKLSPYSVTNIGLSIQLPVVYSSRTVYAILNAGKESGEHNEYVVIPLRTVPSRAQFDRYYFPETPFLIDKPTFDGRPLNSTGMCGEHLIVRSIHEGLGTSPTSLRVSRYNILIIVDPGFFSQIKTSENHYFDLERHDFSFGPTAEVAQGDELIRLCKINDGDTSIYAAIARIKNWTDYFVDILFALKPGSNSADSPSWYCHFLPDHNHGDSPSSSKALKQYVLRLLDNHNTSRARSIQTKGKAPIWGWCVKLGGVVLANDKTEVRIARICYRELDQSEASCFSNDAASETDASCFGDDTASETDTWERSTARSKARVKRHTVERADSFSSF